MGFGFGFGFPFGRIPLGGAFDIGTLNLDLDARTPNVALTEETRRTNGFICNNNVFSNLDTAAVIDQSLDLAVKSNFYTSNFSAGADAFATLTNAVATGNNDAVGGEDDWGLLTCDATTGEQSVFRSIGAPLRQQVNQFTIKVFIPSTNIAVDGLRIQFGNSTSCAFNFNSIAADTVITFTGFFHNGTTNSSFRILALDGTSLTITGSGDEVFYKTLVFDNIEGLHLEQNADAAKSHLDNVNFSVDTDGIDDVYNSPLFLAAKGGDNTGEFIIVFDDDDTGDRTLVYEANAGETEFIDIRITAANKLQFRKSSGTSVLFTETINTGGRNTIFISGDSVTANNYAANTNGVDDAVASGTNDGFFMGGITTPTIFQVFSKPGGFVAHGIRYIGYRSTRLTSQERIDFKAFLDSNV